MAIRIKIKFKLRQCFFKSCFFVCLMYILMRPVLDVYITPIFKYIFIMTMLVLFCRGIVQKNIIKKIGKLELILCTIFAIYVFLNGFWFGGSELVYYGLERYIFLMTPLVVIPLINSKINWKKVLGFLMIFGVIDALFSIYEFLTHTMLFPLANVSDQVYMQFTNYAIIRTYGLNGNYFLLAEILCICGLASFFEFKFYENKWAIINFLIITIGILTTGSRGYYVAYVIGILMLYLSDGKYRCISSRQLLKICVITLSIIILLWFFLGTNITFNNPNLDIIIMRIRQIFVWSGEVANETRIRIWRWALDLWKQGIFFGQGVCCTDTRYSGFVSVTESGVLKRLVELGIVGTVLQYATMIIPLKKGLKNYFSSNKKDIMVIFFMSIIVCFFIEDLVLQRYTELEYTIILWTAIAYIMYAQKEYQK